MSDDIGRVRTLPPEPPERSGSTGAEEAPDHAAPPRLQRAWLSFALIALLGGIAIGLIAGGLGSADMPSPTTTSTSQPGLVGDATEAAPQITTTTTTTLAPVLPPPVLGDLVIDLSGRLLVTGADAGGAYTAVWPAGLAEPIRVAAPVAPSFAAYDAERRFVAFLALSDGDSWVLFLGQSDQLPPKAQLAGVLSFSWHDRQPLAIAWTAQDPVGGTTALATSTIAPGSRNIAEIAEIVEVSPRSRVVAWGDWGFLLQEDQWLWRLAPDGTRLRAVHGRFLAASTVDTLLIEATPPTADTVFPAEFVVPPSIDPERGNVYVADLEFTSVGDSVFPVGHGYTLSPDGGWVVATSISLTPGAIRAERVDGAGRRATSVTDAEFVGWSDDGTFLLFGSSDGTELIVVNWQRGPQFRLSWQGDIVAAVLDND